MKVNGTIDTMALKNHESIVLLLPKASHDLLLDPVRPHPGQDTGRNWEANPLCLISTLRMYSLHGSQIGLASDGAKTKIPLNLCMCLMPDKYTLIVLGVRRG